MCDFAGSSGSRSSWNIPRQHKQLPQVHTTWIPSLFCGVTSHQRGLMIPLTSAHGPCWMAGPHGMHELQVGHNLFWASVKLVTKRLLVTNQLRNPTIQPLMWSSLRRHHFSDVDRWKLVWNIPVLSDSKLLNYRIYNLYAYCTYMHINLYYIYIYTYIIIDCVQNMCGCE